VPTAQSSGSTPGLNNWRLAAIIFLIVLLLRLPTFFRSVLDWDESLYLLMAGQWLAGHLPYTTIWDNKPIGIYAIFALFDVACRDPIVAIRTATAVFVTITALGLYRLVPLLLPGPPRRTTRLSVLAAASFILGALSNDGLAANTEIFMECFSVLAILAALAPGFCEAAPAKRGFTVGLLFALACMTKYVAVFEAPAIAFALLYPAGLFRRRVAGAIAGAALIPAITVATYAATGHLTVWWTCSIAANFLRVAAATPPSQLDAVVAIILPRWLPAIAAACLLLGTAPAAIGQTLRTRTLTPQYRTQFLLGLWLIGGLLGVAAAKSFYDHYFLQILPALCLCLAWTVAWRLPQFGTWRTLPTSALFAALLIIPALAGYTALNNATRPLISPTGQFQPDIPARIAADLRPLLAADTSPAPKLYVFDDQFILYALTATTPPTRYVFPSVLTGCFLARVAGVDGAAEIARILAQNPQFIVRRAGPPPATPNTDTAAYAELESALAQNYTLLHSYPGSLLYRRRPDAARQNFTSPSPSPCAPA
jgi:4-amino-4-deoxy-L-arabinose transferase-like glycosyltransferase